MTGKVPTPLHGPVTASFLAQAKQFKLAFVCEECTCFNHEDKTCVHGYPNEPHRRDYFKGEEAIGRTLIFCRDFDLEGT